MSHFFMMESPMISMLNSFFFSFQCVASHVKGVYIDFGYGDLWGVECLNIEEVLKIKKGKTLLFEWLENDLEK